MLSRTNMVEGYAFFLNKYFIVLTIGGYAFLDVWVEEERGSIFPNKCTKLSPPPGPLTGNVK